MTKLQESQQEFINELISLMEKGKLIWESGYAMTGVKDFNPITGKSYSGGNCFKLIYSSQRNKFADPRWMTFKQAKEHGYILKKGSKGTLLKVYIPSTFERVIDENNEIELREKHKEMLLEDITEKNKIKNKDEALEAIEKNPWILKHIDKKLQENREIVETAIKKEPLTLQYANESLKSDIGLVSIATTKKAEAFKYASNVLKANADFVKQIVDKQPQALQYADALIKNNVDVVLTAAEKDINVLEYAGKQITEDKYVMKTLIMKNPEAIKYVGEKLKKEDFLEKKQTKEKPKLNLSKPSGKGLER